MRVIFRPAARRDILTQIGYYIDDLAYDAAERFPLAVEQFARHQICEQPILGCPACLDHRK